MNREQLDNILTANDYVLFYDITEDGELTIGAINTNTNEETIIKELKNAPLDVDEQEKVAYKELSVSCWFSELENKEVK